MEKAKSDWKWYDRFGIGVLCLIVGYMMGATTVMYKVVSLVMLYALLLGVFFGYVAIGDIVVAIVSKMRRKKKVM